MKKRGQNPRKKHHQSLQNLGNQYEEVGHGTVTTVVANWTDHDRLRSLDSRMVENLVIGCKHKRKTHKTNSIKMESFSLLFASMSMRRIFNSVKRVKDKWVIKKSTSKTGGEKKEKKKKIKTRKKFNE